MDPETESQTKNDSKIGSKIGSILVCFASIILIIIGAIHDNPEDCTNGQATGFLIFGGSILACTASINFSGGIKTRPGSLRSLSVLMNFPETHRSSGCVLILMKTQPGIY